ncbi:MAG: hypothetical protein MUF52_13100 [Syntrophobacteraceae bacterium]|nr:hypothetical protein [Syntrophobacteraceae bacterium]
MATTAPLAAVRMAVTVEAPEVAEGTEEVTRGADLAAVVRAAPVVEATAVVRAAALETAVPVVAPAVGEGTEGVTREADLAAVVRAAPVAAATAVVRAAALGTAVPVVAPEVGEGTEGVTRGADLAAVVRAAPVAAATAAAMVDDPVMEAGVRHPGSLSSAVRDLCHGSAAQAGLWDESAPWKAS